MEPSSPPDSALVPSVSSTPAVPEPDVHAQRWKLVRDLAVFQTKLLVDGLKDLVLAPIALMAAVLGILMYRDDPGRPFRALLHWGHGFDRWVNLFGIADPRALPAADGDSTREAASPGLDAYVQKVERALTDEVRRGGLTAKAKDAIDRALDSLHDRPPTDPPPSSK